MDTKVLLDLAPSPIHALPPFQTRPGHASALVGLGAVVGPAIRVIRLGRGLTQQQLAAQLAEASGRNITQSYICRIERSAKGITLDRLGLILDCLSSTLEGLTKAIAALADAGRLTEHRQLRELRDLSQDVADAGGPAHGQQPRGLIEPEDGAKCNRDA